MYKLCEWSTIDQYGKHAEIYHDGSSVRRLTKTASEEYSPEIKKVAEQIQPDPKKVVILVNAMGAGEFWGSNNNGDMFPAAALKQYYKTFYQAKPFKHHVNKDPSRAYGQVMYSVYNPRMNRVELILEIEKDKAPDIVEKIDNGDDVSVSMGCRCDWDRCSICGHQSSKVSEYCDHLKNHMNEIYPGGKKAYAITPHPRFFDISFVFRGADPTAKMLKKVASENKCIPSAILGKIAYEDDFDVEFDLDKEASASDAVVIEFTRSYLPRLEAYEPTMSSSDLEKIAQEPIDDIFSTATAFGVIIKPQEYQRIMLTKTGNADLANELEKQGLFIQPGLENDSDIDSDACPRMNESKINHKVASVIVKYLEKRSALEPFLSDRVVHVSKLTDEQKELARSIPNPKYLPLLITLSLGYLAYRKFMPAEMMGRFDRYLAQNPAVAIPLLAGGAGLVAGFVDKGSSPVIPDFAKTGSLAYLAPIPAAYVWQAHVKRKAERGEPVGGIGLEAARHPFAAGMTGTAAMLALAIRRSKKAGGYTPGIPEKVIGGAGKAVAATARGIGKLFKMGSLPAPEDLGKIAFRLGDGIAKIMAFGGTNQENSVPPETAKEEGSISKSVEVVQIG